MSKFQPETLFQKAARDFLLRESRARLRKEVDAYGTEIERAGVIRPHGKAAGVALAAVQLYAIRTGRLADVDTHGRIHFRRIPRSESECEDLGV